jgi:hypothetical protein
MSVRSLSTLTLHEPDEGGDRIESKPLTSPETVTGAPSFSWVKVITPVTDESPLRTATACERSERSEVAERAERVERSVYEHEHDHGLE